jgi:hypothetical protein
MKREKFSKPELRKLFNELPKGGVKEIAERMGKTESLVYSVFRGVFFNDKVIDHAIDIICEYKEAQERRRNQIENL